MGFLSRASGNECWERPIRPSSKREVGGGGSSPPSPTGTGAVSRPSAGQHHSRSSLWTRSAHWSLPSCRDTRAPGGTEGWCVRGLRGHRGPGHFTGERSVCWGLVGDPLHPPGGPLASPAPAEPDAPSWDRPASEVSLEVLAST